MDTYADFSSVYDLLMDDFDYPAWAEYYLAQMRSACPEIRSLCDCACGTGSMTLEFARRGLRCTGSDISGEMLERAREKARQNGMNVMFVRQDMCALRLPRPVDALVAACDGVNYLTSDRRVGAFFESAHAALRPGGVLAFDISSPYKIRQVLGDNFFGEERDEAAYLWQNHLNGDLVDMDLTFFVRNPDGLYRRFVETHRQRAHEPERIRALLEQNGFGQLRILGDRTTEPPGEKELRIHFIAIRE